MYGSTSAATSAGATTGVLAATGFDMVWYALAMVTLLAVGAALLRLTPKKQI